ncbi:hypothetical protein BH11PSE11_BH11PSE11_23080 [soil metagenome]
MTALTKEQSYAILSRISRATSLDEILSLFGAEIVAFKITDSYLVNLLDAQGENLVSMKLQFMPEFQKAEQTFLGYKNPINDGHLNSKVFHQRKLIRVDKNNATEAEKQILAYWKVEEIAGVPLVPLEADAGLPPIGTVVLLKQTGGISEDDINRLYELIALFQVSIGSWLRYSHLEEMHDQARTVAEENDRLLQFILEINSLTSVAKIQDVFAAEIFRLLPFDVAGYSLVENDQLICNKVAVASPEFEKVGDEWWEFLKANPYPMDVNASGALHVLMRNEPMLFPDVSAIRHLPMSDHDSKGLAILKTVRTLLVTPIRYQKKPIGILALYSLRHPLAISDADRHLLDQLSTFLGTAVVNAKIYETSHEQSREIGRLNLKLQDKVKDLAEQATTDQLTGLFNFRAFEKQLAKRLIESQRKSGKNGLSIVLIDIDHFKKFNDTYGHSAGNDVLVGVAHEIGKVIRQTDMACRYGGEEFVVILPKCDLEGAVFLAERIRTAIEASLFQTVMGPLSVTVSVGCTVHQDDDTPQTLFQRADKALYSAKNQGRNKVISS